MTKKETIKRLKAIAEDKNRSKLQRDVASMTLDKIDGYTEPKEFFRHFWEMGCKSGIFTELIYYKDTYAFFDKHSEDIIEMLNDEEELKIEWFSKNSLAWFGFERTLSDIQVEIFRK